MVEERKGKSMKKFKAISEIANVPDSNGTIITKEALRDIAEKFKDRVTCVSLILNFDIKQPIGIIQKIEFDGENLITEGEFIKEGEFHGYVVPSYIVEEDEWKEKSKELKRTIKKVRLMDFGLTGKPVNPSISKFEFIES